MYWFNTWVWNSTILIKLQVEPIKMVKGKFHKNNVFFDLVTVKIRIKLSLSLWFIYLTVAHKLLRSVLIFNFDTFIFIQIVFGILLTVFCVICQSFFLFFQSLYLLFFIFSPVASRSKTMNFSYHFYFMSESYFHSQGIQIFVLFAPTNESGIIYVMNWLV